MGILEQAFRGRFHAEGADYVYVRRGHEVVFTADEVEDFVAEWRRLWRAPWLWTGWLMLGVIAPAWIAWNGYVFGAWAFAIIATLFTIVVLIPSWQKPAEIAESRLPDEAELEPEVPVVPPKWQLVLYGLVVLGNVFAVVKTGGHDLSRWNTLVLWGGMFALFGWGMYRHKQGRPAERRSDPVSLVIIGSVCAATVTLTALNPNRDFMDMLLASLLPLMLVMIGAAVIWRHFRPQSVPTPDPA